MGAKRACHHMHGRAGFADSGRQMKDRPAIILSQQRRQGTDCPSLMVEETVVGSDGLGWEHGRRREPLLGQPEEFPEPTYLRLGPITPVTSSNAAPDAGLEFGAFLFGD